jgi:hypothetical protein
MKTQAWFIDKSGKRCVMVFPDRGEASRFVRGCHKLGLKAQILTCEALPQGRFGGYRGVDTLRHTHNLAR